VQVDRRVRVLGQGAALLGGSPTRILRLAPAAQDMLADGRLKVSDAVSAELARTLLRLGADPDIRDHRFDSTPLGWACYFGQQSLIDLLEPLTAPEPEVGSAAARQPEAFGG